MQNIHNATRVVILVETPDRRYGWEVLEPGPVHWTFLGVGPSGTEARVCASGVFHRVQTANPFGELKPWPQEAPEEEEALLEEGGELLVDWKAINQRASGGEQ